jgi:hypothetical protein
MALFLLPATALLGMAVVYLLLLGTTEELVKIHR